MPESCHRLTALHENAWMKDHRIPVAKPNGMNLITLEPLVLSYCLPILLVVPGNRGRICSADEG